MQAEAPRSNVLCKWFVDLEFMMQKVSQLEQHLGWPALTAVRRFVSGFHPLFWAGRVTPDRRRIAAWVHCVLHGQQRTWSAGSGILWSQGYLCYS